MKGLLPPLTSCSCIISSHVSGSSIQKSEPSNHKSAFVVQFISWDVLGHWKQFGRCLPQWICSSNFNSNTNTKAPPHTSPLVLTDVTSVEMQAMKMDAQTHQHTQANVDGLQWFGACCQLPLYDVEKEVQCCWSLAAMKAAWIPGSLKSGALNYEVKCRWDLRRTDLKALHSLLLGFTLIDLEIWIYGQKDINVRDLKIL